MDDLVSQRLLGVQAVRALIGLTLLVGGALGGLEHVTQQNPALLAPLWTTVGLSESAVPAASLSDPAPTTAKPATDSPVVQTLAVADTAPAAASLSPAPVSQKIADVIVPPVKRVKPVTPPTEPVAVIAPEVKTAAVAAAGAVTVAAAKTAKVFAGRSTLGGPVPVATPPAPVATSKGVAPKIVAPKIVAPKSGAKITKQAAAKTTPTASSQKRPGFKLTCTAAQRLDVAKQRCIAIKSNLATATAKPKA
jgi:hypothetical protein